MYANIMIPVDLRHTDHLDKALATAADIAKLYGADAHIVGVVPTAPGEVARTPAEYAEKLAAYAADRSGKFGVMFKPHSEIGHDPSIDLDDVLKRATHALDIDLIVMASHVPGMAEHIFSSKAGQLASPILITKDLASSLRATAHPSLFDRTMTGTFFSVGSNIRSALT